MTENEQALFTLAEALGIEIVIKGKLEESSTNFVKESIAILNKRTKATFRHTTSGSIRLLRALQNQGYTLDDVKAVVESKANEWEHNPEMAKYLRPTTLFNSNKFEGYLQGSQQISSTKLFDVLTKDDWDESK